MNLKIHKSYREVVALCDTELLGKKFEQENKQLDLKESFYKGDEVSEEEVVEILKKLSAEDATFNIVGEKSCAAALKAQIISQDQIKKISDVSYALILL